MTAYRFLEPLDVLFLRGNRLFGDPGSYGESLLPPWPSVAAGAVRTRMLADDRFDFAAYTSGEGHPTLGTPVAPGSFRVSEFTLARYGDVKESVESLHPLPADLFAVRNDSGGISIHALRPRRLSGLIATSSPLPMVPVLAAAKREKPVTGLWLTRTGWESVLAGETPNAGQWVESRCLWKVDERVGVGLDADRRRAEDGKLFSVQAVALTAGAGFLVGIDGAEPSDRGAIRFGGDGRGAAIRAIDYAPPEPDYEAIARRRRCRIILTSPGIFPDGWRLPGSDDSLAFSLGGVTAKLVCAAVPRAETVSGFDLAKRQPKPARKAAPAGSVYWLDDLEASPEALRKLAEDGLWGDPCEDAVRRAEGFNRLVVAQWL